MNRISQRVQTSEQIIPVSLAMWSATVDAYVNFDNTNILRPPLWSSGQSSWLQIQRSGFDSRRHQIFWKVMGLELGPLNLVSTTEVLLGSKSRDSGPEDREYGSGTLYPQK
jgi:hypothetical protein